MPLTGTGKALELDERWSEWRAGCRVGTWDAFDGMPVRCLIDSMIFDRIADEPGMIARIRAATAAGLLELWSTSANERQIAAIQNGARRARLQSVPVQYVGTAGFVLDYSMLDVDRLGPAEALESVSGGSRKHLEDALIAATASADGLPLVTLDRRFRNAVLRELPHVVVSSWDDLRREILRLTL